MQTVFKLLSAVLALSLLAGCAGTRKPISSDGPARIAYVPLDDRPDNVERAVYLAESLDYELSMPDQDLYATRLDGQPPNLNGTQCGNRAALYEWLLAQEEDGCDRYLLSLDQLLSGGLVSSRHTAGTSSVTRSDGTSLTEFELLDTLLETLSADANNQVWLLDSVMRLAPTVGYAGFDLNGYNALRAYGMLARPELAGTALTVDTIVKDYCLSSDGNLAAMNTEIPLPDGILNDYLSARERKLRLSAETQAILSQPGYEKFHLLIGIDDSSSEESIQKNEIAFLRQNLRQDDALLSGVDDLAFKGIAKLYLSECGWDGVQASVRYIGGLENEAACAYDYQPLADIVEDHLAFFGIEQSENLKSADLQVLVLTAPAEVSRIGDYAWAVTDAIKQNQGKKLPTILIDASNDAYGTVIHDVLTEETELGSLLAYSGFLDMAIVTGTALSHGVARYAWLTHSPWPEKNDKANDAFVKALSDSVIKDFCFRNTVRNDLYAFVRDDLSGSPENFDLPKIEQSAVLSALERGMAETTAPVLENFSRSSLIVSLSPYAAQPCGALTLSDYRFPWNRVFEIGMEIHRQAETPST